MKNSKRHQWPLKISESRNVRLQAAALRMARRCRRIIQTCLREEEWHDADIEFCAIILSELERLEKRIR